MATNKLPIIQNLTIANWNANGLKAKRSTFIAFLARHNVDIACVSETHLINNENFKLPGYTISRADRNAPIASGGVAIVAKRSLITSPILLNNLNNLEAVMVKLKLSNNINLNIACAYQQPNRIIQELDVSAIFANEQPTLLLGDLNSKHTVWGCRVSNPNGNRLYAITARHAIQISAPSDPTYFPYRTDHRPDILDITLHKNFSKPIYQTVLSELDSDHLPVLLYFFTHPQHKSSPPKLITGYVDWETFQITLNNKLTCPTSIDTNENIDSAIENLTTNIKASITEATTNKFQRKPTDFMSPPMYILRLIKEKHRTRRLWQQTRQLHLRRLLNHLTHRVKWELDNLRFTSYSNYIKNINPGDHCLWQVTKRILRQSPTTTAPLQVDNKVYSTDEDKCCLFSEHLENIFTPNELDYNTNHEITAVVRNNIPHPMNHLNPTSPNELMQYIKQLSNRKSPGHDLVTNIVLKNLTNKAVAYIASLLNACLRNGYFPDTWKHAHVLLFLKPRKNGNDPSSYRPISLLPTLSKLFEKVIQKRLNKFLTENNVIPTFQFGFRPNHATSHQLLRVTEKIERGFENKMHTTAIFLDIAQAFDRVWSTGLLYKILQLNPPPYLINIISSFLNNRTFAVKINSTLSETKAIKAGVPQGSILGPTLFNILMYDIPQAENCELAMYADDTVILSQHHNIEQATQLLQNNINSLQEWFRKWGIQLNSSKCEAKIFTLRRPTNPRKLVINNQEVEWNPKDRAVKYLGVHLDRRLTWGYHINQKLNEAYVRLAALYPVINRKTSLKVQCAKMIYQAILRPILTYGCTVWGATSKTNIRKLQIFQSKVLRIIVKAPWFVRNVQIHQELAILTVEEFIKKTSTKFFKNINECPGAAHFSLGERLIHHRLRRKMPQDLIDSD
jgi:hypothetical protein